MNTKTENIKRASSFKIINLTMIILLSIVLSLMINFYPQNFYSIAIFSIVTYVMFFLSWFIQYENKINYYTIFLVFTYLFYFSQFFLLLIDFPMLSGRTIIDGRLPYDNLIDTGIHVINFMLILHIGVLISTLNINKHFNDKQTITTEINERNYMINNAFRKIGILLFSISFIPSLVLLINNIKITLRYGYGATFQSRYYTMGGFNNIVRFLSLLTIPSLLILLISYKGNKKIKWINMFTGVYLLLYFLGGSRLNGVLLISSFLLIKHYWYKSISKKEIFNIGILGIIGLIMLSVISSIRNSIHVSTDIVSLLSNTIKQIYSSNPLFIAMEEAGYTFLAIGTVLTYCPSIVPYYKGMSYLNSILLLIPNLFWDVHPAAKINTDIVFKGFLTQYGGIGSSFISEAYFNFGKLSLILAIIFGLLIGVLCKKIDRYSKEGNSLKFYLYIYIAQLTLFYVRSDTVSFWRNFVYYGLIPILIVNLFIKKKKLSK